MSTRTTEVARGDYHYWRDEKSRGITEPWSLSSKGDALILKGKRIMNKSVLLEIEAHFTEGGWHDLIVSWMPGTPGSRRFEYHLRGDKLEWLEQGVGSKHTEKVPARSLLFPLLRGASGPLLQSLAKRPATVILPTLGSPPDSAAFLQPMHSPRRATLEGAHDTTGIHYRYYGGEYGETGSDFWVTRTGIVDRYKWKAADGEWDVRLMDGWAAPDFNGYG